MTIRMAYSWRTNSKEAINISDEYMQTIFESGVQEDRFYAPPTVPNMLEGAEQAGRFFPCNYASFRLSAQRVPPDHPARLSRPTVSANKAEAILHIQYKLILYVTILTPSWIPRKCLSGSLYRTLGNIWSARRDGGNCAFPALFFSIAVKQVPIMRLHGCRNPSQAPGSAITNM